MSLPEITKKELSTAALAAKENIQKKKKNQLAGDLGKTKDASNGGSHIVIEWCVCVC